MEHGEHPDITGGKTEQQERLDGLVRSAGQPIIAFDIETGSRIIGVSHGYKDGAVWIRDSEGEVSGYDVETWQVVTGEQALLMIEDAGQEPDQLLMSERSYDTV
jgi:hypothetical protein